MMKNTMVYSIVVTYNGMQWIARCLDSLLASNFKTRIVVIDNNSKDDTAAFIKENYSTVQLIETRKNLGFGQGNNIGLNIALKNNATNVFLLNQDAYVETNTIGELVKEQQKNTQYGILSPIHLNGRGTEMDGYFYQYLIKSGIKPLIDFVLRNKNIETLIIDTPFVNAAAWLISADCLKNTGGFDPIFFHYGEDGHYINRAIFKGFKIGILGSVNIFHDRERIPVALAKRSYASIKNEWVLFLNQACNIQQQNYKGLMLRRFIRHSILGIANVFTLKKESATFNLLMAKKIISSFASISKSRNISITQNTPHLNLGKDV